MRISNVILLLVILISGCDPPGDERMHVINDSPDTLWYYYTTTYALPDKNPFNSNNSVVARLPDTSARGLDSRLFLPHENKVIATGTGKWDPIIASPYSDSSLTFYSFSTQTVRTVPWDTIRRKKLYKSYKFTLDQIRANNWQLKMTPK